MSAFLLSRRHIDVLVRGLAETETVVDCSPDAAGRELWRANVVWLAALYPGDYAEQAFTAGAYTYTRPAGPLDLFIVCGAAHSWLQQTGVAADSVPAGRWIQRLLDGLADRGVDWDDDYTPTGKSGRIHAGWHLPDGYTFPTPEPTS